MKKYSLFIIALLCIIAFNGCNLSTPKTQPAVNEPEAVEKRVSFLGCGDNLIHNSVYWQADSNAPGADYDFLPMYQYVEDKIKNADISYINQETILGGTSIGLSSYPMFNSPQELGRDMITLGFDLFSHATNHVFDKGETGVKNTYEFYENNPSVTCIGIHKNGEDKIKIIKKDEIKIAFINYTYHTNGLALPKNSKYYVPIDDYKNGCENMASDVKRAKEMADFVVCMLHWGNENQTRANEIQKESSRILSEVGCDVIIGTHPHAIQPVEYVNDTLVVYSLGNFISAQKNPLNMIGGMISFDFVKKGEEKRIENVVFHPVITQFGSGFKNIRIIPFEDYNDNLAAGHSLDVSYGYFKKVIDETIDKKFLNYE